MIIEVVGKEIEKIKGDFESYLNGLNMVGEISYSQYSELYDEGTKQIQKAYELGKSELENKNADLKEEINKIAFARGNLEEENAELRKELQKWKDEWQEQVQKATDESYARTLQTMQLTKATKIIKDLCGMVRELNKPNVQLTNIDYSLSEAEQFLSEVEK